MADLVKFTIDGRELEAPAGTLVIEAAKAINDFLQPAVRSRNQ